MFPLKTKPKILTIIGPTASGKTELSAALAEEIEITSGKKVEFISADSRQIYKHIPIATAQPPREMLSRFKHHFVNELELDEEFNAGTFGKEARERIEKILAKGNVPVIVGGSGLYLSSLMYGLFELDDVVEQEFGKLKQKKIRAELNQRLADKGIESLTSELKKIDAVSLDQMKHVTARRVIRALEVFLLTGLRYSELKDRKSEIGFEFLQYGIDWEREKLYDRINKRTDNMIEDGLIEEIEILKKRGYHYSKFNSLNTVGVKEVFDYLDGAITRDRMIELIKQNTRRYAKRQLTWFRRDKEIVWMTSEEFGKKMEEIAKHHLTA